MLNHEAAIRASIFFGLLIIFAVVEYALPKRRGNARRTQRWPVNIGLVLIDTLIIRVLAPGLAVAAAVLAQREGWGVFGRWDGLPTWLIIMICIVLMDAFIYWQHRLMHKVPVLWRLHRVHHADTEFDVTTALRFHPLEIVFSLCLKAAFVVALGVPVIAIVIFEVLLNASAMFNHANIALPAALDRSVRPFVVTPDMHRVHHSSYEKQTNSNYGFFLSLWDRLFASYQAEPAEPHETMQIGLVEFRERRDQSLWQLLIQPFRRA
ncbi:MAG: sterol desaturase family protein [Pseudomonadota bacterium]